jgi:deoxyribonuclease-1
MQADMYNLYPAIGSVNAARLNYNFTQFQVNVKSYFGSCAVKIQDKKVEPPFYARGIIARTYQYFEATYSRYKMSHTQRQLMYAWDKKYPVTEWECIRTCRIEKMQKNENKIVKDQCIEKGLWPQEESC